MKKKIIKPMGTGWKPSPLDPRDANWNKIFGAVAEAPPPTFTRPVPDYVPFQDSINCCVWATAAADQEYSSRLEGHNVRLSFRYGYANTPGGSGGRGYRESADWLRNKGIPEEQYCLNDWQIGVNKFLDVSSITPEGIDNANRYRIKNYSFINPDLTSIKTAAYRKPVWIAVPGMNADWKKPVGDIVHFTGDINNPDWWHSMLYWDWVEGAYSGVLNWWGDRYRRLALDYPIVAAMSTEDLPDDWQISNMDYIILPNKEQFLLYLPLKMAFNIGDEEELKPLQAKGLSYQPKELTELPAGFTIYPLISKSRPEIQKLFDLFGVK